ncbi:hypothetical protein D3C78_1088140 [compost metagenome]
MRFDVTDPDIPSERLRDAMPVTGEQQLATQSKVAQLTQGKLRLGFDAVGQQQPGKEFAVERQPGNRTVMIGNRRCADAQLRKQLRPAERRFALLGHRHHAQTLALMDVREQQEMLLGHQPRERTADRVTAGRAQAGGERQDMAAILQRTVDGLQAQGAEGQRPGLVDHQRSQVRQLFKERRTANQNPVACRYRHPGNRRGRRRQHQRTRTGRHQHREHRLSVVGDEPGHRRQQQHQHHIAARVTLQQTSDRRFRALGVLHQGDDFAEGRFLAGAGHFDP